MACVLVDLKRWGTWDITCGHKANVVAPSITTESHRRRKWSLKGWERAIVNQTNAGIVSQAKLGDNVLNSTTHHTSPLLVFSLVLKCSAEINSMTLCDCTSSCLLVKGNGTELLLLMSTETVIYLLCIWREKMPLVMPITSTLPWDKEQLGSLKKKTLKWKCEQGYKNFIPRVSCKTALLDLEQDFHISWRVFAFGDSVQMTSFQITSILTAEVPLHTSINTAWQ